MIQLLQSAKLTTTWPGETPRPSPIALPRSDTKAKLKSLFQINCKQKSKNNGTAKYGTVWQIQKVMALHGNQNDN